MSLPEAHVEHEMDPALQRELLNHPGKWVVIDGSEIIGIGDTAEEARTAARSGRGFLYRVLDPNTTHYF